MSARTTNTGPKSSAKRRMQRLGHWKLEDAKARLSEVVRRAKSEGPQVVTVRGEEAAVVLSAEEFAELSPASSRRSSLVDFLESLPLAAAVLEREPDSGRDRECET
ncbi:MAG: type II toxin-antitoxin system Phd/YefM family antitoxin [Acidobacteriaceae bacterium]